MVLSVSKYLLRAGGPAAEVTQTNSSKLCHQLSLWRPPRCHCLPGHHPQHQAQDPLLGALTLTPLPLGGGTAYAKGLPWWLSGNPLQYPCLGKPTDRGGWWATVHGVTKNRTQLKRLNNNNNGLRCCPHLDEVSVNPASLGHR